MEEHLPLPPTGRFRKIPSSTAYQDVEGIFPVQAPDGGVIYLSHARGMEENIPSFKKMF
jgi:hypothetical protein